MEELVFKTGAYEGPLDLLLALIAKNKMNIFEHEAMDKYIKENF